MSPPLPPYSPSHLPNNHAYSFRVEIHPILSLSSLLHLPRVVIPILYPSIFSMLGILGNPKSSCFLDSISEHHPDVVAVTDTSFSSWDAAVKVEYTPTGYQLLDRARLAHRQGGDTALFCRDSFTLKCNGIW